MDKITYRIVQQWGQHTTRGNADNCKKHLCDEDLTLDEAIKRLADIVGNNENAFYYPNHLAKNNVLEKIGDPMETHWTNEEICDFLEESERSFEGAGYYSNGMLILEDNGHTADFRDYKIFIEDYIIEI